MSINGVTTAPLDWATQGARTGGSPLNVAYQTLVEKGHKFVPSGGGPAPRNADEAMRQIVNGRPVKVSLPNSGFNWKLDTPEKLNEYVYGETGQLDNLPADRRAQFQLMARLKRMGGTKMFFSKQDASASIGVKAGPLWKLDEGSLWGSYNGGPRVQITSLEKFAADNGVSLQDAPRPAASTPVNMTPFGLQPAPTATAAPGAETAAPTVASTPEPPPAAVAPAAEPPAPEPATATVAATTEQPAAAIPAATAQPAPVPQPAVAEAQNAPAAPPPVFVAPPAPQPLSELLTQPTAASTESTPTVLVADQPAVGIDLAAAAAPPPANSTPISPLAPVHEAVPPPTGVEAAATSETSAAATTVATETTAATAPPPAAQTPAPPTATEPAPPATAPVSLDLDALRAAAAENERAQAAAAAPPEPTPPPMATPSDRLANAPNIYDGNILAPTNEPEVAATKKVHADRKPGQVEARQMLFMLPPGQDRMMRLPVNPTKEIVEALKMNGVSFAYMDIKAPTPGALEQFQKQHPIVSKMVKAGVAAIPSAVGKTRKAVGKESVREFLMVMPKDKEFNKEIAAMPPSLSMANALATHDVPVAYVRISAASPKALEKINSFLQDNSPMPTGI